MLQNEQAQNSLELNNFSYEDLNHSVGLKKLDEKFLSYLRSNHTETYDSLISYRSGSCDDLSNFLLDVARCLEFFIADLFKINNYVQAITKSYLDDNPILNFKNIFVIKESKRNIRNIHTMPGFVELQSWLSNQLQCHNLLNADIELSVSQLAMIYLTDRELYKEQIASLIEWCCHCQVTEDAKEFVDGWISFQLPQRVITTELISVTKKDKIAYKSETDLYRRDGFVLTDQGKDAREVRSDINQCIYCHDKDGDFCSKGFPVNKKDPDLGFKRNDLDNHLLGCPLEQKISEMNLLKKEGLVIAPFAVIMRDNPTCALTGHRICNDCQKACIFQKQDPVDVPQIETKILKDLLALPWGVEIYDLFTKWNPLIQDTYFMQDYNGYKVLVMGMGPSGITLSHYLLMEGCAVVGMDGLKIEDLENDLLTRPVKFFKDIADNDLGQRKVLGFGGVAEYGITARWNKNYLKLVYLSLLRKKYFQVLGSVRFGGTITIQDAWDIGFDHLAIAVGAGLPKEMNIPGSLAKGMRAANDFLMALHLTGATKSDSFANLQVELPALVIGGGLTGVDTATELQALYIQQVERVLNRYETLIFKWNSKDINAYFPDISLKKLYKFLQHGREVRLCRLKASEAGEKPNFAPLLRKWGGVTIVYRKRMIDSPAYRNNHFELQKALEEGIYYAECCDPKKVILDENQYVKALKVKNFKNDIDVDFEFPAKNIFFATGAKPNVAYGFEHAKDIQRLGYSYVLQDENEQSIKSSSENKHCKDRHLDFFSSYNDGSHKVSVIGDTNPAFQGSVVKAIASAKQSYKKIVSDLRQNIPLTHISKDSCESMMSNLSLLQHSYILAQEIEDNCIKVTIYAPLALKNFKLGNFFRVQNYEKENRENFIEPVSIFPSHISDDKTNFTCYIEKKLARLLCRYWQVGEKVAIMGPTGVRANIKDDHNHTLLFFDNTQIGPVRLLAERIRQFGYRVDLVLSLDSISQLYAYESLKEVANELIICCSEKSEEATRLPNLYFGELSDVILKSSRHNNIILGSVTKIIVKGQSDLINRVKSLRFDILPEQFKMQPKTTASVLGPMQCMLKGVCAQCLQWQIDPVSGERTKAVYSCSWQDQPLEIIALDHLESRNDCSGDVISKLNELYLDDF
ncbi:MAG: FAD-dependent oxidoreductase [Pseudomonadota bacterium]|nr:FAD-dependent oxidoreductase [Pseudomonadota bacterium]